MARYIQLGSMTFWTGVSLVGFGIYTIVAGAPEQGAQKILEGLGLIFLRRAVGGGGGV